MDLSRLSPNKGSRRARRRVGRGNAAGSGRTSGRGEKGQKSRSGGSVPARFEGGQMPLYRRIPKVGFTSRKRRLGINQYNVVNFDALNRFDEGAVIDPEVLRTRGFAKRRVNKAGVKIIASGTLEKKLTVKVHAISAGARARIEELGGTVELIA